MQPIIASTNVNLCECGAVTIYFPESTEVQLSDDEDEGPSPTEVKEEPILPMRSRALTM